MEESGHRNHRYHSRAGRKVRLSVLFSLYRSKASSTNSLRNARRQTFQECSDHFAVADDAAADVPECSALGSFLIPLLAIHGKNSEALQRLVAMAEMRTFEGSLTHMPEVAALLSRRDAATAREILDLPANGPNENLAFAIP